MRGTWLWALLHFLYPPRCPGCRRDVAARGAWCDACLRRTVDVRALAREARHFGCLESCTALCVYRGAVGRLLRGVKFRRKAQYLPQLAWLAAAAAPPGLAAACDAAVPVPLSAGRERRRGFNQAGEIFRGWCAARGLPWRDVLRRTAETRPQWRLTAAQRRANVAGAFAVTDDVRGLRLLLVDDICTSGATLEACARVLKQAGAARVDGLVLASDADCRGAPPAGRGKPL